MKPIGDNLFFVRNARGYYKDRFMKGLKKLAFFSKKGDRKKINQKLSCAKTYDLKQVIKPVDK